MKSGADFQDAAEVAVFRYFQGALGSWQEREFRAASAEATGFGDDAHDGFGGGEVDAKGFFGKEVFAGAEDFSIDRGVQVVGQGDVDDVDLAGGQQFTIVARFEAHGGDAVEPC